LNSKKVVLYIENRFSRELSEDEYLTSDDYKFKTEKRVEEKANSLINREFMEFIREVNSLFLCKGYNVKEFSNMLEKTFSVD